MTSLEDWVDGPTLPDLQLCCTAPGCTGAAPCDACILATDACEDCGCAPVTVRRLPGFSPVPLCAGCATVPYECVPEPVEDAVTARIAQVARERWALQT